MLNVEQATIPQEEPGHILQKSLTVCTVGSNDSPKLVGPRINQLPQVQQSGAPQHELWRKQAGQGTTCGTGEALVACTRDAENGPTKGPHRSVKSLLVPLSQGGPSSCALGKFGKNGGIEEVRFPSYADTSAAVKLAPAFLESGLRLGDPEPNLRPHRTNRCLHRSQMPVGSYQGYPCLLRMLTEEGHRTGKLVVSDQGCLTALEPFPRTETTAAVLPAP